MGEEAITGEACGRAREENVETPIPVNNGKVSSRHAYETLLAIGRLAPEKSCLAAKYLSARLGRARQG